MNRTSSDVLIQDLRRSDASAATEKNPTDIAIVPQALLVDEDDTPTLQSEVMKEIVGAEMELPSRDAFYMMAPRDLKLSRLKEFYTKKDKNVLSLLSTRHNVVIDDDYTLKMGVGQILMETTSSMIDYHLTVGNCLGLSPLLPNTEVDPMFCFELDLKSPIREFKRKHAMLGFDPAGMMLYIGKCRGEDVYLAMAPNDFLVGQNETIRAGFSSGSPQMPRRHYRQTVMMLTHFLAQVRLLPYDNNESVYTLDLDSEVADFHALTDVL
jgi:hypothetical protein